MRLAAMIVLSLGACGFDLRAGTATDDAGGNPADSNVTGGDAGFGCYGTGIIKVCPITQPVPDFEVTAERRLDTGPAGGNCTAVSGTNVSQVCVVIAEKIDIRAALRVVGSQPLVLVGTTSITIDAALDTSSRGSDNGAGASTTSCMQGPGPQVDLGGAGGGAGGSFLGSGGKGGSNVGGNAGPTDAVPAFVHGGCRGQKGAGVAGGNGGMGGGVAYLIAGTEIEVKANGFLNASGHGGDGAGGVSLASGGGGGGAGGMIVLDAPDLRIDGAVFANGGGGGGGSDMGFSGSDGTSPLEGGVVPAGGGGGLAGGRGGDGGAMTVVSGAPGAGSSGGAAGGGGGGGGAGYILFLGTRSGSGPVSPPPN